MYQNLKAVLFDLDGTLLPMDQDKFLQAYFSALTQALAPHGYEPQKLMGAMWKGIRAMIGNDGSRTNEEAFWVSMRAVYGAAVMQDLPLFDSFYHQEFRRIRQVCGYQPLVPELVRRLRQGGLRVILATNPVFPAVATRERIRWAGLEEDDLEYITTFENCRHCKPDPAYYTELAADRGLSPSECLMVGNDVEDDMIAETVGMQVFLLTDCLIDPKGRAERFPHGDFAALMRLADDLIARKQKEN